MFQLISHILEGWFNFFRFWVWPPYRKVQKKLFDYRLSVCEACPSFYTSFRQCRHCGCFVDAKTKVIYEIGENGLCIDYRDHRTGDVFYACPEKKW